jgi:hypothetical protein
MCFHPSLKAGGLHPTAEAPFQFRDWVLGILKDWDIENCCAAHFGVKVGNAKQLIKECVEEAEDTFKKMSDKSSKLATLPATEEENFNVTGNECG